MDNKFLIPIKKELINHGFRVGKKVYEDKLKFSNKWDTGQANALQADVYGFIAEAVVCDYFSQPLPELTKGKNDCYDLVHKEKRIDVKKVGYSRASGRTKITLNKRQFDRKKDLIDQFLFCTFEGAFNKIKVCVKAKNGKDTVYEIYVPVEGLTKVWLIGYINTEDVIKSSKIYVWKDREGNPTGESYWIKEKKLRPVEELLEESEDDS